jgi:hypothetical protein
MLRTPLLLLAPLLATAPQDAPRELPRLAGDAVKVAHLGEDALATVRSANRWLAAHRTAGGAWAVDGDDGEPSLAASGLALLALLADGSTTRGGPHPQAVREAAAWMLPRAADDPAARHKGIALLALSELARLDPEALEREPLQRLSDRLAAQAMALGGFPAYDETRADAMATAWAVAGLCEARRAGLEVPDEAVEGALRWIEEQVAETGEVRLETNAGAPEHGAAVFLLPRLVAGRTLDRAPYLRRQAGRLTRRAALPDIEQEDLEYWFAASTGLALAAQPEAWAEPEAPEARELRAELREGQQRFHAALVAMLREEQLHDGGDGGAWLGLGWAPEAGLVRSTAMGSLALAAPCRVAPLPPPPPVRGKFGSGRRRRPQEQDD